MTVVAFVLVVGGCTSAQTATTTAEAAVTVLGDAPLGVNVAAWDTAYTGVGAEAINQLLRSAGARIMRYPGGSWADEFDWTSKTDTSKCSALVGAACSSTDPLGFDEFASQARAIGATSLITVNYGSGTPSQAAAWVVHVGGNRQSEVALWEVGNENYSCYETNMHLATPPTNIKGYVPRGQVCPDTAVMAESYAAHSPAYIDAIRRVDPSAQIGVPWAFSAAQASGSAVTNAATWNRVVLNVDGRHIDFVDAHWYPFDATSGVSDQQLVESVRRIPAAAAALRSTLAHHSPVASFVVGETDITERETTLDFQPVSALFAAATSLEWLAEGAKSVLWWDLNNYGSPTMGDYGMLASGPPEPEAVGQPLPPYFGEELASMLASPGARLSLLSTGSSDVLGFQSDRSGSRHVLLINANQSEAATVTPNSFEKGTEVGTSSYDATSAAGPDPVVQSSVPAASALRLPPQSIIVLAGAPRP